MVIKVLTDGKIFVTNLDYTLIAETEGSNCDSNNSGSVTGDTKEGSKADFDRLLRNRWETHMSQGHFRYGLDVLETRKVIHDGMYLFFCGIYIYIYNIIEGMCTLCIHVFIKQAVGTEDLYPLLHSTIRCELLKDGSQKS